MKNFGVHVRQDLTWSSHIDENLKNLFECYVLSSGIPHQLPFLMQSLVSTIKDSAYYQCIHLTKTKTSVHNLETFEKRVLKWMQHDCSTKYQSLLEIVNMLLVSMFFQILDLLELSNNFKLWISSISGRSLVEKIEFLKVSSASKHAKLPTIYPMCGLLQSL